MIEKIRSIVARTVVLCLTMSMLPNASSQDEFGVLSGTVYGPDGAPVPDMPIQATHTVSGEYQRTRSAVDGHYELIALPPGLYELRISTPCCAYQSYESEDVVLVEGTPGRFDIRLAEGSSFNTVGDDPGIIAAAVLRRQEIPDLPVPTTPDGKPDLSGVWIVGADPYPQKPDAREWAAKLFEERVANEFIDHPHNRCLPGDPPFPGGGSPFIGKIVQKTDLLVFILEDAPGYRQVFLDGRNHPEDPNPSWMGHSIGRWDGAVLVIDTVGFNSRGWNSGYPRTEDLHMIERYERTEYGHMELELIMEDTTVFKEPWTKNIPLDLAPQEEIIEYVCENNKWAQPLSE